MTRRMVSADKALTSLRARIALGIVVLSVVALLVALLAIPMLGLSEDAFFWVAGGALVLLAYGPATLFAVRAKITNPVLRYFYGLTAAPVFAVIFVWMLHRLFTEFPFLDATFTEAQSQIGGRSDGFWHAAIVTIPTAVAFLLWYGIIRLLDKGVGRLAVVAGNVLAGTLALAFTAVTVFAAHDAGLIGSAEWRLSRRSYGGAMPSGEWLAETQFRQEVQRWRNTWFYPRTVEGRCDGSVERYRADWKALREGQRYSFYFGLPKDAYERHDRELRGNGYAADSTTNFRDCAGNERYQGTWTIKRAQRG